MKNHKKLGRPIDFSELCIKEIEQLQREPTRTFGSWRAREPLSPGSEGMKAGEGGRAMGS